MHRAGADRDGAEERREQREADEPELGERLELERVRVADDLVDVALAQPRLAEAARARRPRAGGAGPVSTATRQ